MILLLLSMLVILHGSNGCVTDPPVESCAKCDELVKDLYTGADANFTAQILPNAKQLNSLCHYTCPDNHNILVKSSIHIGLSCDMETGNVTVNNGIALAENKFQCGKCNNCSATSFGLGEKGLCRLDRLCTLPYVDEQCTAKCPQGSEAIFINVKGTADKSPTTPNFSCVGKDWIAVGSNQDAGITCQYVEKATFFKTPPKDVIGCPAIANLTCTNCNATELIYVPYGRGYQLTCQNGFLITDKNTTGLLTTCNDWGEWDQGITQASCDQGDSLTKPCLDAFTEPAAKGQVNYFCKLGKCYVRCKNMKHNFRLEINGKPDTHQYLKCNTGKLQTVYLDDLDVSKIRCA